MNNVEYAKRDAFKLQLINASESGQKVYENTINKLNNCPYARMIDNKFTIKDIFSTYWDSFCELNSHKEIRPAILTNVEKMISCEDLSKGYIFYECPTCENFHISGLSCHSRFCPSCGKVYRERRANEIAKKCINVPHRQFVFSIAKELRDYFRWHRDLYDELFHAVNDVFEYLIQGKSKIAQKEDRELGYMMFLHTFGRDLKHNPHIHVLIAERVIDNDLKMKRFEYFDFEVLRKAFMNQLLKRFYKYLKNHASRKKLIKFSKLRNYLYITYPSGFYTHGPKLKNNSRISIKNVIKYISRYAGPKLSLNQELRMWITITTL